MEPRVTSAVPWRIEGQKWTWRTSRQSGGLFRLPFATVGIKTRDTIATAPNKQKFGTDPYDYEIIVIITSGIVIMRSCWLVRLLVRSSGGDLS